MSISNIKREKRDERPPSYRKMIVWETRKSRRIWYRHVVKNTAALGREKFISQQQQQQQEKKEEAVVGKCLNFFDWLLPSLKIAIIQQ